MTLLCGWMDVVVPHEVGTSRRIRSNKNTIGNKNKSLTTIDTFELPSQYTCQVSCLVAHRILIARRKLLKSCQSKWFRQVFNHAENASIQRLIYLSSVLNILHAELKKKGQKCEL